MDLYFSFTIQMVSYFLYINRWNNNPVIVNIKYNFSISPILNRENSKHYILIECRISLKFSVLFSYLTWMRELNWACSFPFDLMEKIINLHILKVPSIIFIHKIILTWFNSFLEVNGVCVISVPNLLILS